MRNPKFMKLIEEIVQIHETKNADYATTQDPLSNFKMCEVFAVPAWKGCLVRLSDKWSRITQLATKPPAVKGETLRDTLIDLANYSLICILLLEEEEKKKPLELKEALGIGK